jgi:hypothetical protein
MQATDHLHRSLLAELGIRPNASADVCTDGEWEILSRAVDLIRSRMRVDLEVGLHQKRLLPCDALIQAGILSTAQVTSRVADGYFDAKLCSLPLRPQ